MSDSKNSLERTNQDSEGVVAAGLGAFLKGRGYSPSTIRNYIGALHHFRTWLDLQGRSLLPISAQDTREFMTNHIPECNCQKPIVKNMIEVRAALNQVMMYLGKNPKEKPASAVDDDPSGRN